MSVVVPRRLDEVFEALVDEPEAHVLAGGTDLMVELNAGHRLPAAVVAIDRVPELQGWQRSGDQVTLGAGLTYTEMLQPDLWALLPALADAARTVGSPQIRNAGTLGGNLATASPAGDTLPVLAALDATVMLGSASGSREVSLAEFVVGPKRTSLRPQEVVLAVRVPVVAGPQGYLKVGTRNAMVIAVCSLALVVDVKARTVRCALGSVGPTPVRATEAEAWVLDKVDWEARRVEDPATYATFGEVVAAAARPIDDHRSTATYRRHAVGVLARRALMRAL
jgi:CO/xanthine dehydrogenase FAD-binding subunit